MSDKDTGFVEVRHFSDLYHGMHSRVFSREVHGDHYLDLAKEFAKTNEPLAKKHQAKVSIAAITAGDAKVIGEENAAKERERMMDIYRSKGWVDEQGRVRAPKALQPSDYGI